MRLSLLRSLSTAPSPMYNRQGSKRFKLRGEWALLPVLYHGPHGADRDKEGLKECMVTLAEGPGPLGLNCVLGPWGFVLTSHVGQEANQ